MACSSFRRMCQMTVPFVIVISMIIYSSLFQETQQVISIHRAGNHKPGDKYGHLFQGQDESDFDELFTDVNTESKVEETSDTSIISLPFLWAILSTSLVGLSGIFPIFIFKEKRDESQLNRLLCFAVGGLLGDVFLHLLPESWQHLEHVDNDGKHTHKPLMNNGLLVLVGLISFTFLEKIMAHTNSDVEEALKENPNTNSNNNKSVNHQNGTCLSNGHGVTNNKQKSTEVPKQEGKISFSGYLNLFANCVDNFTHGLAIGGSYNISLRVGVLTTVAILFHEIPHEIGDFAILLRAGFNRWKAAKLQISTALGGIIGVVFSMCANSAQEAGNSVAWILPFTSGGFLYIALCTVVPDLLKETNPRESFIQVLLIVLAIAIMGIVGLIH